MPKVMCFSILCLVVALAASMPVLARQGGNDTTAVAAVRSAGAALSRALAERDLDRILTFYAQDASLLPGVPRSCWGSDFIVWYRDIYRQTV